MADKVNQNAIDYSTKSAEEQMRHGELTPAQILRIFNLPADKYRVIKSYTGDAINTARKKYKNVQLVEYELQWKNANGKWEKCEWNKKVIEGSAYNNYAIYGKNGIVIIRPFSLAKNKGIDQPDVKEPGHAANLSDTDYSGVSGDSVTGENVNYNIAGCKGNDHERFQCFSIIRHGLIEECYESCGYEYGDFISRENITIKYKNRTINNPLQLGYNGNLLSSEGDDVIGGSGIFTGKSSSEKFSMCHVTTFNPNECLASGLITTITVPCRTHRGNTIMCNKYAANDILAILNEIKTKLPWYDNFISSDFRTKMSAHGHSRHQVGLALDINAGSRGNPWFHANISKNQPELAPGTPPPWAFKSYSCGGYDRKRCIWHWGHPVVKIFQSHGWDWGGSYGDVMHFSIDGH